MDDADQVVGYYALTMGGVRKEALPARYGRGLPKFDIGMVLLARFAIADDRQGQRQGCDLLSSLVRDGLRRGRTCRDVGPVGPTDSPTGTV